MHQAPFSARDEERFGFETFRSRGMTPQAWDCSKVVFSSPRDSSAPSNSNRARVFKDVSEIEAAASALPAGTLAVLLFAYMRQTLPIFRALSRAHLPYAIFTANTLPSPGSRRGIPGAVFHALPSTLFGVSPAVFMLAGGAASLLSRAVIGPRTKVIWIHSLDVDALIEPAAETTASSAVFLDECVPFHPDYTLLGLPHPVTEEEYYPRLRRLFDRCEEALGLTVSVAAHPRSDYENRPPLFGDRAVVRGRTAQLIRNARLVLAHGSTSVNYAVMLEKPVAFLTDQRLKTDVVGRLTETLSRHLGKRPIDLDRLEEIDWRAEMSVDRAAYASYREAYVKRAGSPWRPFWEVVADAFSEAS